VAVIDHSRGHDRARCLLLIVDLALYIHLNRYRWWETDYDYDKYMEKMFDSGMPRRISSLINRPRATNN